jgi:hypothetical protein
LTDLELDLSSENIDNKKHPIRRKGKVIGYRQNSYPWACLEDTPTGKVALCLAHDKVRIILTECQIEEITKVFRENGQKLR